MRPSVFLSHLLTLPEQVNKFGILYPFYKQTKEKFYGHSAHTQFPDINRIASNTAHHVYFITRSAATKIT